MLTIISISPLLQSFFYLQPIPGSDTPSFATNMKINNAIDNASHIYYDKTNRQNLNNCVDKNEGTCLDLKLKMMKAGFVIRDYNYVTKIYNDLRNINSTLYSNLSKINHSLHSLCQNCILQQGKQIEQIGRIVPERYRRNSQSRGY